ncbi:MAG: class I tRNA ligase family protein [Bradymonadaceae bacterium]
MFLGPLEQAKPWDPRGVTGVHRFLSRIWRLVDDEGALSTRITDGEPSEGLLRELHKTIKKVTDDTEALRYNTAIAGMMEFVNFLYKEENVPRVAIKQLVQLLAPYAPHTAEELWERLGDEPSVSKHAWPTYDEKYLVEDTYDLAVQVMGKLRGTVAVPVDVDQDGAVAAARANEEVTRHLEDKEIRRIIFVPGRILNFVVS